MSYYIEEGFSNYTVSMNNNKHLFYYYYNFISVKRKIGQATCIERFLALRVKGRERELSSWHRLLVIMSFSQASNISLGSYSQRECEKKEVNLQPGDACSSNSFCYKMVCALSLPIRAGCCCLSPGDPCLGWGLGHLSIMHNVKQALWGPNSRVESWG